LEKGDARATYRDLLAPLRNQRMAFIFDECHRSQFGDTHKAIRDFFPKAQKAAFVAKDGVPEIPTLSGGFGELQESIQNIASKLEKVPFEQVAQDLRKALQSLDVTLKKADTLIGQLSSDIAPELRATLEQARKTLGGAEKALGSDSPLQGDLRETLLEVTKAAESVRALTDYLERHPESLLRGKRSGETTK